MISVMDRLLASTCSMAGVFYLMASAVAWLRVIKPPAQGTFIRKTILDRALAWSSLSAIFFTIVLVALDIWDWEDPQVAIIIGASALTIFFAGLNSVNVITFDKFGYKLLLMFGFISVFFGLFVFLV